MKQYIGIKVIKAKPMGLLEAEALLGRSVGYKGLLTKEGDAEGYLVEYPQPDNLSSPYQSWSPKEVFEEAYFETSDFSKKELYSIIDNKLASGV